MKFNQVCISCFKKTDGFEICQHCGCVQSDKPKQANHLYPFVELNDRYVIGKVINNGGFGVVYKAYDKNLNSVVAIKELFPTQNNMVNRTPGTSEVVTYDGEKGEQFANLKKRFLTEAKTMSMMSTCDSIVDVYDFFEANNTAYFVMEFLDGLTLREYMIQNPEPLGYKDAMDIIEPVIRALSVVHKAGIIHRDVSPDNVFITGDGKVKLIDFGAAKLGEEETEKTLAVVAKPGYTPPEQYRMKSKIMPYTDIYATGATLYRIVTGKLPEESIDRLEDDQLEKPSKLGFNLPLYAEKSIMKAMALDENARFKSMDDFLLALKGKKKADYPEKELKRRKTIRWISFASVMVLAVFAVAFGLMFKGNTGIIPSPGNHTIIIWLTDTDKKDKDINEENIIWENIAKTGFKNFCASNDKNLNVTVKIQYIKESEYNKKYTEAKVKPDIYRSDLVENSSNYSASLSELYSQIDNSKVNLSDVYSKIMKKKYSATNEFAVRYDTLVFYSYKNTSKTKAVDFSSTGKNKLTIDSNALWYLADEQGYVKNNDYSSINKLTKYVDTGSSVDNFADNKSSYFISTASVRSDFDSKNRMNARKIKDCQALPGDSGFYAYFPERFAISNSSSEDNQKTAMFYLYYVLTNNIDLKDSHNNYLLMNQEYINNIDEDDEDKVIYNNISTEDRFTLENTTFIKELTSSTISSIKDKSISENKIKTFLSKK